MPRTSTNPSSKPKTEKPAKSGAASKLSPAAKKPPKSSVAAKKRTAPLPEALRSALACAAFAGEKKAEGIVILDIRELSTFADFLVICSGTSEPHLKAIASGIREGMRESFNRRVHSEDGIPASQWIVIDYVDVVVHIFAGDRREYYGLESLWGDAPRVPFPQPSANVKASASAKPERRKAASNQPV